MKGRDQHEEAVRGVRMKARERQATAARTEELIARLVAYREENERLRAERGEAIRKTIELRAERDALREELRLWQRGRRKVGDALFGSATEEAADGGAKDASDADSQGDDATARDPLAALSIFVVGGSAAWQRRAAERFPYLRFIGSDKGFDETPLRTADVLVINTNAVSHAATEKAKRAAKGAVLVLTSTNNLDIVHKKIVQEVLS